MDALAWTRQGVLVVHAVAFAIALSAVLREDLAVIRTRQVDLDALAGTARTVTFALAALWLTGLLLVLFQVGLSVGAVTGSPKLAAKLLVVCALTANGLALHVLVFSDLKPPDAVAVSSGRLPALAAVLGAISTASWLAATFIGLSRMVSSSMRLADYMTLYAALLVTAVCAALLVVRPMTVLRRGPAKEEVDGRPRRLSGKRVRPVDFKRRMRV